ncbi:hypothetical protein RchiOBHm_Chr7g0188561 [Rosa chinensis]|uniref:Uncharacterized protein n=1 Tax=Rosa chinensis TaxID=74649 RepID=A0A2P6P4G9_ROSCH|nr:hypothetical protein RchiOBHm_Chr7g0188561 [Rosa chinensis]
MHIISVHNRLVRFMTWEGPHFKSRRNQSFYWLDQYTHMCTFMIYHITLEENCYITSLIHNITISQNPIEPKDHRGLSQNRVIMYN